ncbi:hypothetical protein SFC15_22350 [Shouchella clausii]
MYSIKQSFKTFLKAQVVLILLLSIPLLNMGSWKTDDLIGLEMFIYLSELFALLLAFIDGFHTKKPVEIEPEERGNVFTFKGFLKSLWFLAPVLLFMTLTMGHFDRDAVVPFPSALILGFLLVNGFFNFLSLFVPSYVVLFYGANVYDEGKTAWSEGFRYTMLYFWSLNAEIQNLLSRFPFYIQRPITLLLCIWYIFAYLSIGSLFGW